MNSTRPPMVGSQFGICATISGLKPEPSITPITAAMGGRLTPDQLAERVHAAGYDRPLFSQYLEYLGNVLRGDFGTTFTDNRPVTTILATYGAATAELVLDSLVVALLVGVPLGMLAAYRRDQWPDAVLRVFAILGYATPVFFIGLLLKLIFSVKLGWLPLLGAEGWKSYILPSVCLGIFPMAVMSRMTRSSMVDVLGEDYIRTARAKGLAPFYVYFKHALRNALIPIVTIIALNFGSLIGGAVVTESVFNWPGIGRYLVDSVRYRDYPVIQGVTMITVASVVVMNLVGEMIIARINPKIRFD